MGCFRVWGGVGVIMEMIQDDMCGERRHPSMGQYLPIEVAHAPICCIVYLWGGPCRVGGGKPDLLELK